jgi:hypothetical protein
MDEKSQARLEYIRELEEDMKRAADDLDFEEAASIRDQIFVLQGKAPLRTPMGGGRKRRFRSEPPIPRPKKTP